MTETRTIDVGEGAAIPSKSDWGLFNAWTISIVGAVGAILSLILTPPAPYKRIIYYLADGVVITFQVTVMSILCACCIGLIVGLGRVSKNKAINLVASTYVEIIRGIPLLVQLFYIYYALGRFLNVHDLTAAIIAMSVCYGAYMGEVFRAGITAIDKGQTEASRSLGFNTRQTMFD